MKKEFRFVVLAIIAFFLLCLVPSGRGQNRSTIKTGGFAEIKYAAPAPVTGTIRIVGFGVPLVGPATAPATRVIVPVEFPPTVVPPDQDPAVAKKPLPACGHKCPA